LERILGGKAHALLSYGLAVSTMISFFKFGSFRYFLDHTYKMCFPEDSDFYNCHFIYMFEKTIRKSCDDFSTWVVEVERTPSKWKYN